jgi:alpha-glucosidase (family GH31 glycosyl hydrolase)
MTYFDIMKKAIYTKYSLNRYYYSYLSKVSSGEIGAFYKPLFFEYPDDINAY